MPMRWAKKNGVLSLGCYSRRSALGGLCGLSLEPFHYLVGVDTDSTANSDDAVLGNLPFSYGVVGLGVFHVEDLGKPANPLELNVH